MNFMKQINVWAVMAGLWHQMIDGYLDVRTCFEFFT